MPTNAKRADISARTCSLRVAGPSVLSALKYHFYWTERPQEVTLQRATNKPFTLLVIDKNGAREQAEQFFRTEAQAKAAAQFLSSLQAQVAERNAAVRIGRVQVVRTLDSISIRTKAEDLSIADLRWLTGEAVDRLEHFDALAEDPETLWAHTAILSVADRRDFTAKYTKHVLSALRCALSVERRLCREAA